MTSEIAEIEVEMPDLSRFQVELQRFSPTEDGSPYELAFKGLIQPTLAKCQAIMLALAAAFNRVYAFEVAFICKAGPELMFISDQETVISFTARESYAELEFAIFGEWEMQIDTVTGWGGEDRSLTLYEHTLTFNGRQPSHAELTRLMTLVSRVVSEYEITINTSYSSKKNRSRMQITANTNLEKAIKQAWAQKTK